ncbi:chorismate-binding protein [Escherichia coli]|nr:chorismate-binding protein [Escherichia coli]
MDTSLAEEVQQTMATLAPNRFFFMSPYRSFTTSGCFARFDEPAVNGDSPDSPFQQKLAALFADAKAQGIKNPVMVGAIPFDPRQPSSLYIPESWQSFSRQEKQASARRFTRSQSLNVVERQAIPEQATFEQMVARAAALTATPQVDKVVLSRLIDITTPTLWHLATPFEGKANLQENALTLACLLHPTPALSGFPHQAATQVIAELEPFDRELFGGIVGWCDSEGNGEWVVTIRCAKLRENQVRLFAGAGIVPASSPLGEWRETGVKLSTMLNVFGLH